MIDKESRTMDIGQTKIHYVENNGLKVYGFAVDAIKETRLNIVDSGKVCNIKTQENS